MVDKKSRNIQWSGSNSSPVRDVNTNGYIKEGQGHMEEQQWHINVLELISVKYAILTFMKRFQNVKSLHLQIDNTTAIAYFVKMGGTQNKHMTSIPKEIWEYLFTQENTATAEYLPSSLNVQADWQCRGSLRLETEPNSVSEHICKILGQSDMDLFASRLYHQLQITYLGSQTPSVKGQMHCRWVGRTSFLVQFHHFVW